MGSNTSCGCCCCCGESVPSPDSVGVIPLTDIGAKYIQLPSDTAFVESSASNDSFQRDTIFIPLQRGPDGELYIYSANVGESSATLLYGPITLKTEKKKYTNPNGTQTLTPFGSALTSDGRMWIAVFNRSLVVEVNLNDENLNDENLNDEDRVLNEVHVPAPNDICVDPLNEDIAYAAGGSQTSFCCFTVTNATRGKIYKVSKDGKGNASAKPVIRGLSTLAGIEKMDDELFTSVLYKMFKTKPDNYWCCRPRVPVWRGQDAGDVWLADNIQKFDPDTLVIPAYRTLDSAATCFLLGCRPISAIGNCLAQCATCIAQGENCAEAFRDPEVALEFSIRDTEDPLRLFLLNKDGTAKHYSVSLDNALQIPSDTRRKYYFDSNVTAVSHVKDKLVCVNFQQPRILLLPDAPFMQNATSRL